jgi:hypothetical protein
MLGDVQVLRVGCGVDNIRSRAKVYRNIYCRLALTYGPKPQNGLPSRPCAQFPFGARRSASGHSRPSRAGSPVDPFQDWPESGLGATIARSARLTAPRRRTDRRVVRENPVATERRWRGSFAVVPELLARLQRHLMQARAPFGLVGLEPRRRDRHGRGCRLIANASSSAIAAPCAGIIGWAASLKSVLQPLVQHGSGSRMSHL